MRWKVESAVLLASRLAVGMERELKRTPRPRPEDCAGAPFGGMWSWLDRDMQCLLAAAQKI